MAIRRIGQILVDLGFINDEQLEMLLEEQRRRPGELLGKIAEEMGLVTDEQLAQGLAEQMGMQMVSIAEVEIPEEVLEMVTEPMAQLKTESLNLLMPLSTRAARRSMPT